MKTRILALALAASMAAGTAFAQTSTTTGEPTSQEGGSEAAAGNTDRGTPLLPEEMMSGFYTDSTMGTMRSDAELMTMWTGMTAEQQAQYKAGCAEEFVTTQRNLPESYKNVCMKVNAM